MRSRSWRSVERSYDAPQQAQRRAGVPLDCGSRSEDDALLAEIAVLLGDLEGERRQAARRLLEALRDLAGP